MSDEVVEGQALAGKSGAGRFDLREAGAGATRILALSGILVGFMSMSFVGLASCLVGRGLDLRTLMFSCTVGVARYAVDRLGDALQLSSPQGSRRRLLGVATAVALLVAGACIGSVWSGALAATFPLAVAHYPHVKQIPYAKSVYVPFVWGGLTLMPSALLGPHRVSCVSLSKAWSVRPR